MGNTNLFFKKIIQFFLKWFAKIYLWQTKPYVIIIAGTTGRYWIKEAVKEVLEEKNFSVRTNRKNFNAEIGLPLSILGLSSGAASFWQWLKILWLAFKKATVFSKIKPPPPQYLILEMAIDRPENMRYLTSIIKPNALILTTITMIYAENFENLDEISREYGELIKTLSWNGILILNNDDLRIRELGKYFKGKIITFGFTKGADFLAKNIQKVSDGQKFEISVDQRAYQRQSASIKINRFGQHHIYAELVRAIIKDNFLE